MQFLSPDKNLRLTTNKSLTNSNINFNYNTNTVSTIGNMVGVGGGIYSNYTNAELA
jgi:hypothetical protein